MIWLVQLKDTANISYDSYIGFVIRADSERQARELAQAKVADEGRVIYNIWMNPQFSDCYVLPHDGDAGIILSSFHAG